VYLESQIKKIEKVIKEKAAQSQELQDRIRDLAMEETVLRAELEGLRAHLAALEKAHTAGASLASASAPAPGAPIEADRRSRPVAADIQRLTLVDAIAYVVNGSDVPMRIAEVQSELERLGRDDKPPSVSMTLHYAAANRRIRKVARGVYARSNDS
jgi:chromosome segregation ATPase